MIVIKPTSGLCNKLRATFSYWEYAKLNKKKLTVIWEESDACPGFFLDYFEPVNGITFLKKDLGNLKIDYCGNHWHPDFNPYTRFIYSDLRLQKTLQTKVDEKLKILGDFIAIQIRRTDYEKMAKEHNKFTTDEEFCNFIDKYPNKNLFITADNNTSFDYFKKHYSARVKIEYPKNDPTKLRHTSLEDAVVDMFVCIYATEFKKSGYSSFGDTIDQLRKFHLLNAV